jgi:hypothetical protein
MADRPSSLPAFAAQFADDVAWGYNATWVTA